MLDRMLVNFIVTNCEAVGALFLADFLQIDRFTLGFCILIVLIGSMVSVGLGGKKNVR